MTDYLWRMHHSQYEAFSSVDLGPYEAAARKAILDDDPEHIPELDVILTRFDGDPVADAFCAADRFTGLPLNGYYIGFVQHSCLVKVDKRHFPWEAPKPLSKGLPVHMHVRAFDGSPEKGGVILAALPSTRGH